MPVNENENLYAVLLGGRAQGCHIELHDIVFVVTKSLEDAYPKLTNKWFGITKGLHVDSSVKLDIVDGYEISLHAAPPSDINHKKKLYFTHFGGYQKNVFGEMHESTFYVGGTKKEVNDRAMSELCDGSLQQHCDDNIMIGGSGTFKTVDDLIEVGCVDGRYVHLTPTDKPSDLEIISDYRRIDIPEVIALA